MDHIDGPRRHHRSRSCGDSSMELVAYPDAIDQKDPSHGSLLLPLGGGRGIDRNNHELLFLPS